MKNIVKENKQFLLAFFGVLFIILSCSIFVSNSNMDPGTVTIQSITPVYDEEATYSVGNTGVIFNDKDQVVKYNVVIENAEDYDVKISDLQFGTQSEEFLKYTVENVELDDVIKAGETKELVISFETVKMDGWGRNFNDEIVTTLVFDRTNNSEVVIPPVDEPEKDESEDIPEDVPTNESDEQITNNGSTEQPKEENVPSNNVVNNGGSSVVQPELKDPVVNEPQEEVKEPNSEIVVVPDSSDTNHEIGVKPEVIVKNTNGDKVVVFVFGIATGVLGIGLVMVNKNKFAKYLVVFIVVGSTVRLASANETFSLEIPISVGYESQNVMMAFVDEEGNLFEDTSIIYTYIANVYIENEIREISNYVEKFDVSYEQNERVIAYIVDNNDDEIFCRDEDYYFSTEYCWDLYLQADGIIYPNENMSYYFAMENLNMISNLEGFDTSNVTNMSHLFWAAGRYNENLTLDLRNMDLSNVTDMSYMFSYFGEKAGNISINLSNMDLSSVTNMEGMFENVGYDSESVTIDLSMADTRNVANMIAMFNSVGEHASDININLSNINTSNVTNMSEMFNNAGYYCGDISIDISDIDTSNVVDMSGMFASTGFDCNNSTIKMTDFDMRNVTDIRFMFHYTYIDNGGSITISNPNVSYNDMTFDLYTNGSDFVINYTNETESVVEDILSLDFMRTVKGWNVDVPITFTIGGTTYNAYEGMTWKHWVNSEFNTAGYYESYGCIHESDSSGGYVLINEYNRGVILDDEIINDYTYIVGNLPTL